MELAQSFCSMWEKGHRNTKGWVGRWFASLLITLHERIASVKKEMYDSLA